MKNATSKNTSFTKLYEEKAIIVTQMADSNDDREIIQIAMGLNAEIVSNDYY